MPRVPSYDDFQAAPQVFQPTPVAAPFTPEMASVPGRQLAQTGAALEKLGDAEVKIQLDIQKDINEAAAKEADNTAANSISQMLHDPEGGYLTSQGKQAVENRDTARRNLQKIIDDSGQNLSNDMQRQMYKDVAQRRSLIAMQQIDTHAAAQSKQWAVTEGEARMNNARRDATQVGLTYNVRQTDAEGKTIPNAYDVNKSTMIAETNAYVRARYGADENSELAKQARLGQTTQLHADVVGSMLQAGKTDMARAYYKEYASEVAADKRDEFQKMIDAGADKDDALRLAMDLKGGLGAKLGSLDTMYKEGKINENVHKLARAEVEHRFEVAKRLEGEGTKATIGNSVDWFIHNPGKSVLDFQQANPGAYNALKTSGHLADLITLSRTAGKVVNDDATWAEVLSDPQSLKSMTPTEIYNKFRMKLDDQHLEKAYGINAALNGSKDEQHLSIMSTSEMVKDSAVRMGIIDAASKPSEDQAKNLNAFQRTVDDRISAYEQTVLQGKRKASQDELRKILENVEMDKVYKSRSLWFDKQVPTVTLTPVEMADAYVKVGDEEIALATIPAAQRAQIIPALRRAGRPITEQNIADYWVRGGKKK